MGEIVHQIGWMQGPRASRKRPGTKDTLECADQKVIVEFVGKTADEGGEALINAIKDCAMTAAGAVGIATIIGGPAAAYPAFSAAFGTCMEAKMPGVIAEVVSLRTRSELGEWGPC